MAGTAAQASMHLLEHMCVLRKLSACCAAGDLMVGPFQVLLMDEISTGQLAIAC